MAEAAALPEAFATSYLNLFIEGDGKSGETLLMHAGASGLASVVIPMAKSFGMRVITSVLSDEKANSIKHLGADVIINSSTQKSSDILKAELESGHPVNLAIDCLGGEMLGECIPYVALKARWIVIATLAGDFSNIPLKALFKRGVRLIGSTLRSRTPEFKAYLLSELVKNIWPKVESGEVRPTIYKIFPVLDAQKAHAILERGENVGKVVLKV
jgi:NADPH:quinone reductase-like Zn-dependent oxidoreductase